MLKQCLSSSILLLFADSGSPALCMPGNRDMYARQLHYVCQTIVLCMPGNCVVRQSCCVCEAIYVIRQLCCVCQATVSCMLSSCVVYARQLCRVCQAVVSCMPGNSALLSSPPVAFSLFFCTHSCSMARAWSASVVYSILMRLMSDMVTPLSLIHI